MDKLRVTIKEVADDAGISYNTRQAIFGHEQCVSKMCGKIVEFRPKAEPNEHCSGDVESS